MEQAEICLTLTLGMCVYILIWGKRNVCRFKYLNIRRLSWIVQMSPTHNHKCLFKAEGDYIDRSQCHYGGKDWNDAPISQRILVATRSKNKT